MKNFKDFISEEKPNIKRKAKGEQDFVDAHNVEVTDVENQGTEGSAKVNTKAGSGKHKADKDNKQEFGEEQDTPGNSYKHQCAIHVKSEQFGEGTTITSQHAEPDENGDIEWYDIMFEHGIEQKVLTSSLEILVSESHMNHKKMKKESVKPDVEKAFPASGVRKHPAPKSTSTMPKDKEKAKGRPAGSFKEEVEELDELKTSTLWSYRNKARDELDKAAQSKEMHPKVGQRMKGILDADVRTLARKFGASKYGVAKGYNKEEVELEEETQTYLVKFEKNGKVSVKNYEAKSDLDARSKAKVDAKRMGMNVSSVRLKEEVEQIDELSKKTLKNYAKKAEKSYFDHQDHRDISLAYAKTTKDKTMKKGFRKDADKHQQVMNKRRAGFDAAHRRMPIRFKEEVELDELSNKLLNRYAHKAGQSHAKLSDKRDELQWQHDNMKGVDKDKHKKRIADIDRKLKNRERGMDSADHDRLHRQEEVELDEELTNQQKDAHFTLSNKHRLAAKTAKGREKDEHMMAAELHKHALQNPWYKNSHNDAHRLSKKLGVHEEVELDEEQLIEMDAKNLPFTPDAPKKNPPAKAGKYGQGHSTAKHLAQQGLKKTLRTMKKSMQEADFSKQQTKMAHTIGKEFEKKGVGDEYKGGPYAVASAMVRDKPEAAKKAYKTIQSKMKEEADAELLFNLYNDLNEENQEMFMSQLEEDADSLLEFARMMEEE